MRRALFAVSTLLSAFSVIESAQHVEQDSLLQKRAITVHGASAASEGCAKLTNHGGSYFTIPLEIGTPSHNFDLVVDTGSDSVIVTSCDCSDCDSVNKCFKGNVNDSSTFVAPTEHGSDGSVALLQITFGSGTIFAEVASDLVQMAGIPANMTDGLLLMMYQQLDIDMTFEGIFGIGLPQDRSHREKMEQVQNRLKHIAEQRSKDLPSPSEQTDGIPPGLEDFLRSMGISGGDLNGVQLRPGFLRVLNAKAHGDFKARLGLDAPSMHSGAGDTSVDQAGLEDMLKRIFGGAVGAGTPADSPAKPEEEVKVEQKNFMVTAGIERFSMCFGGDAAGDGQLLVNSPKVLESLGNYGAKHWALALGGISIGQEQKPLGGEAAFCTDKAADRGLAMNCGAIPDSGTTLIMAPQSHVDVLLEELCEGWQRCRENRTALDAARRAAINASEDVYGAPDPFGLSTAKSPAADVLKFVLSDCHRWLDPERSDEQLNAELPAVHFRVEGSDHTSQLLTIQPSRYVLEQVFEGEQAPEVKQLEEKLGVKLPDRFCDVAFGAMEYDTPMNGHIWILGTPLFYQYHVGFDLQSLGISFTEGQPCGTCGEPPAGTSALVGEGTKVMPSGFRGLRQLAGKPRLPSYNKQPFAI